MSGIAALYQSAYDAAVRLREFVIGNRKVYDSEDEDDDVKIEDCLSCRQELIDELAGYQDEIRRISGEPAPEDERRRREIRGILDEIAKFDEEDKVKLCSKMNSYLEQSLKARDSKKLIGAYMETGYIEPREFDAKS